MSIWSWSPHGEMKQKLIIQLYFAQLCIKVWKERKNVVTALGIALFLCKCLMIQHFVILFFFILQVFNVEFCYFSVFFILQVFNEIAFCYFSVFLLKLQVFNDIAFCYFLFFFILQVLMIQHFVIFLIQATALDNNQKTVTLSNGTVLNYDSVLIATGGK